MATFGGPQIVFFNFPNGVLILLDPPSTPFLTHETTSGPSIPSNSLKVVRDDNVKVACLAGPGYQWSSQSGVSQIFTINNIQTDTTRTCTATNTMQTTNSGSAVSLSSSTIITISVMCKYRFIVVSLLE